LKQREGSTGLFVQSELMLALEEELKFSQWGNYPLTLAHYEIRGTHRLTDARPTIVEMLALRRAAQRVVEITETLLVSIVPITSGRTGPLKFCVSMTGPNLEEARHVVEQVVSQVQSSMPGSLELVVNVVAAEPGMSAQQLLG
jgi:serine/threonine-protein kinase